MRTPAFRSSSLPVLVLAAFVIQASAGHSQDSRSRRSQRVKELEEIAVASPDGQVTFKLLSNAERLSCAVTMGETTVIEPSPLQLSVDGFDLTSGVVFGGVERAEINETYPWHGGKAVAVNRCRVATVSFTHDLSMTRFSVEIRAFDDGAAYRFIVPGEESASRVPDERSAFVIPAGSQVWYHGMDGHYEAAYRTREISEVPAGDWAGVPLTFKLPGDSGYGTITEANLVNYSGMALEADGRRGWVVGLGHRQPLNYPFELRYGRDEGKRLGRAASITGTITTPWRVVVAGRDLNTLVNSDIVHNLCPPADARYFPDGVKTDWVTPGLAVWRYVDGGETSYEGLKDFSRLGGDLGVRYHVIEGVWSRWSEEQVREIVEDSKSRGVQLLFWIHSNRLRTTAQQDEFFDKLRRYGVAGAKIDFMDHEAKEIVDLYETLLEQAAKRQLVVNFHGANKPSGRMRTWPNDMVREAVRGMETSSFRERARHQTTLPFTRCLAGPADYSTMIFTERRRDTTWAHQIASLATLSSPLLTIAAHPKSILANPAVDVIKSIPAVWDETRVLPGSSIGELSIFARRKGTMWMLAVMCGPEARTIDVPLSFLGEGAYQAALVRDDDTDDAAVVLEKKVLRATDSIQLNLKTGGGMLVRFNR